MGPSKTIVSFTIGPFSNAMIMEERVVMVHDLKYDQITGYSLVLYLFCLVDVAIMKPND